MKRDFSCGLDVALAVVGGKWKPLVLFHLGGSTRRFGELRRLVMGISEKVLIQQLKELEADGILSRTDHRELPPRVDYAMTAFGRTLATALMPLCAWGDANRIQVEQMQRIQAEHEPLPLIFSHNRIAGGCSRPTENWADHGLVHKADRGPS